MAKHVLSLLAVLFATASIASNSKMLHLADNSTFPANALYIPQHTHFLAKGLPGQPSAGELLAASSSLAHSPVMRSGAVDTKLGLPPVTHALGPTDNKKFAVPVAKGGWLARPGAGPKVLKTVARHNHSSSSRGVSSINGGAEVAPAVRNDDGRKTPLRERIYEGSFALLFLVAVKQFVSKLHLFAHGKERDLVDTRFHVLACLAALTTVITHALVVANVEFVCPWRYVGRLITTASVVSSLGYLNARPMSDICVPLGLSVGAWALLAASSSPIADPSFHWGLVVSGAVAGTVTVCILHVFVSTCSEELSCKHERLVLLDAAIFSNSMYLLLDMVHLPRMVDLLLNGCIDLVYAWGVHHLILKREKLIERLCSSVSSEKDGQ